jgi:membrane-associated phospholipid phosphatase
MRARKGGDSARSGRFTDMHARFIVEERVVPARTRRGLYAWGAGLVGVGATSFFVILADVLRRGRTEGEVSSVDRPYARLMQSIRTPRLTKIMIFMAVFFGPVMLPIIIVGVVVSWSVFARHAWRPLLLAGGMGTGVIIVQTISRLVGRRRPPADGMLYGTDASPSFPSGHVMGASDFALLIAYLVFSRREKPGVAAAGYAAAGGVIAATAVSRLYLGYHWLSDALASISLSLMVLGGVILVDTKRTVRSVLRR